MSMKKKILGIDLGGTFIKGGVIDPLGKIITDDKIPTECGKGAEAVAENIAYLSKRLMSDAKITCEDVSGIGIGVPGMIDSERGVVVVSENLKMYNFEIRDRVEKLTGLTVKIVNDANAAALGEARFGCGKNYKTSVLFTLGTGVGGGIVIDKKLYLGNCSAAAELGHSVIVAGGERCSCGRRGCLEAYASATALIRETKKAMQQNSASLMWGIGSIEAVDGKTAFDYYKKDAAAQKVVDEYIEKLAVGIVNIANELRPEAVIIGGGVSAQGKSLTEPLQRMVDTEIYGQKSGPQVEILIAELGNRAGILGAAALWMD